jgi:xylose isomerase
MEPTKPQYDFDAETAAAMGLFGSVDANRALLATTPATAGTPTSSP